VVPEIELPDKLFFKIGEVAKIIGVRPHVLRYWESEFPALRPMKTRGYHRVYKRRDVELAMLIRRLVQQEGFTIPGARRRLRELDKHRVSSEPDADASKQVAVRADLLAVRRELSDLLKRLDSLDHEAAAAPKRTATITVTAVIPGAARVTARSDNRHD
jgi:DNA-binding transcriptional MerR regulator